MTFTNRQALEARFGFAELAQLTDRGLGQDVNDTVLAGAIAAADAVMTPYLHGYDPAALAAAPDPLLGEIALHLARAALYVSGKPDEVANLERQMLGMLRDISNGVMQLRVGTADAAAASAAASVAFEAPDRTFTADSLAGYGC